MQTSSKKWCHARKGLLRKGSLVHEEPPAGTKEVNICRKGKSHGSEEKCMLASVKNSHSHFTSTKKKAIAARRSTGHASKQMFATSRGRTFLEGLSMLRTSMRIGAPQAAFRLSCCRYLGIKLPTQRRLWANWHSSHLLLSRGHATFLQRDKKPDSGNPSQYDSAGSCS